MTLKGLRYHDEPVADTTGHATASALPDALGAVHNFAAVAQFQALGCALNAAIPPGPPVDLAFITEIHTWLSALAPDATVRTVGALGRNVTCVLVSEAKLKRNQIAFHFTSAAGMPVQFDVRPFPVKARSEVAMAAVAHSLAGALSLSNVTVQATDSSFRQSYEEAKTIAAEVGVEEAMRRLEAHAGQKHPLLKRRQIKDELTDIAKRSRFEKRPVPSPIIPQALLLGWQTKVLARLGATLQAPRRTLLWVWSTAGNAGKSSFGDHLAATFRWGVFRASSRSNQHGVGHRYAEEGLIIFDLARNARLTTGLLELMELVTNTGATLTTEKYQGSDPTLRASVLVFANRDSPRALRHRAVYELQAPAPVPGELVCDGNGDAACGCAYHARLRVDLVTDFARAP